MPKHISAIFILCGHGRASGGSDDGAKGAGTTERKEAADVVRELAARLQADPQLKSTPLFTIGLDKRLSVAEKTKAVNDICRQRGFTVENSLLIEAHLNSSGTPAAEGLEVWYYAGDDTAKAFAQTLVEELHAATGEGYHGSPVKGDTSNRWGRLGIVRDTIPLAALLELGYLSNPDDASQHLDPKRDDSFSLGVLNGLRRWIGYPTVGEAAAAPAPDDPPPAPDSAHTEGGDDGAVAAGPFTPNAEMRYAFDVLLAHGIFTFDSPRDEFNYRLAAILLRAHNHPLT